MRGRAGEQPANVGTLYIRSIPLLFLVSSAARWCDAMLVIPNRPNPPPSLPPPHLVDITSQSDPRIKMQSAGHLCLGSC